MDELQSFHLLPRLLPVTRVLVNWGYVIFLLYVLPYAIYLNASHLISSICRSTLPNFSPFPSAFLPSLLPSHVSTSPILPFPHLISRSSLPPSLPLHPLPSPFQTPSPLLPSNPVHRPIQILQHTLRILNVTPILLHVQDLRFQNPEPEMLD